MTSSDNLKSEKKPEFLLPISKSFEDIGLEDLSEQEFQDVFDVIELLIRVENRLRSERLESLSESA